MSKQIAWTRNAKADVRALDQTTAMRVLHALSRYAKADVGDVKQLADVQPPEFRLHAGDYRVRFLQREGVMEILSVRHRREAYRDV